MKIKTPFVCIALCTLAACATAKGGAGPAPEPVEKVVTPTVAETAPVAAPDPAPAPQVEEESSGTYDYAIDADVPDGWTKRSLTPRAGLHTPTNLLVTVNEQLGVGILTQAIMESELQAASTADEVATIVVSMMKQQYPDESLSSGKVGNGKDRAWVELNLEEVPSHEGPIHLQARLEIIRVRPPGTEEDMYVSVQSKWIAENRKPVMAAIGQITKTLRFTKAQ